MLRRRQFRRLRWRWAGRERNFIDDDGLDDGDACLDDCSFTSYDDEVGWGWDCAGFTDIASSCLADWRRASAGERLRVPLRDAVAYQDIVLYRKDGRETCACDNFNVCDSGITGYENSLPSDAVDHGTTNGGGAPGAWTTAARTTIPSSTPAACWGLCALKYPDSLVAIDLNEGSCCCQDRCECMANIEDGNEVYTDASITTLPADCGGDDDDDDVGPLPATCADGAANSEFIWECGGGPVYQQGCVDEWHAYVECKWNYRRVRRLNGPSCSLSCADALSSPAPAPRRRRGPRTPPRSGPTRRRRGARSSPPPSSAPPPRRSEAPSPNSPAPPHHP